MAAPEPVDSNDGTMAGLDRALSALWLAAGVGVCVYARSLGIAGPGGPGSGFVPLLAGLLMSGAGAVLLATAKRRPAPRGRWPRGGAARRVLLVLAGTAIMVALMRWLGFVVAAMLAMPVLLAIAERRSALFLLGVGWGSAVAVYLLFGPVLGTLLPRGPWGF